MLYLSILKTFKIEQLLGSDFPNEGGTQGLASPTPHCLWYSQAFSQLPALNPGMP